MNPKKKLHLESLAQQSLKKLSLSNCGLTSLPPELADFHWLERLDVSDNPLQESHSKKVKLQRTLPMILHF
jgi:Leucine-rich repeat (LRR) protein